MSLLLNPIEPPKLIKSWINNDAAHGSGRELPVFYPATGEQVSILVEDGPEDVNKAVISARKAFDNTSWSKQSVEKRIEILESCRKVILDNLDENHDPILIYNEPHLLLYDLSFFLDAILLFCS